jgi:hypothetical protein
MEFKDEALSSTPPREALPDNLDIQSVIEEV